MGETDPYIDAKIELFIDYMAGRAGRNRRSARTSELMKRFKASRNEVDMVMTAAHTRGLVHIWRKGDDPYYIINLSV